MQKVVTGKLQNEYLITTNGEILVLENILPAVKFNGKWVQVYGEISKEEIPLRHNTIQIKFIKIAKIKPLF